MASPKELEHVYLKLMDAVELYYTSISLLVASLPILTVQATPSTGELGSVPAVLLSVEISC